MNRDSSDPPIPSVAELHEWSFAPYSAADFSPFGVRPFLVLDAEARGMPSNAIARIGLWLQQLPCPSIGIAAPGLDNVLTRACDVLVSDARQAELLIGNIRANPIAAAVLVQTLRATAELAIPQALAVESLAYATLQGGVEFRRWLASGKPQTVVSPDPGPPVVVKRVGDDLSVELNRPSNRNAISVEMRDALNEALQLALADESIRTVRVSGRGKCFSVGGDLSEFGTLPDPASAHAIRSVTMPGRCFAACAARLECHVHGACIGSGVELPAFAQRVTAAEATYFHMPELRYGLIPGGGGCVSLPRRIGRQRTAWFVLSGKRINARTALEWGLIDAIL